jgi:hypothetical protein
MDADVIILFFLSLTSIKQDEPLYGTKCIIYVMHILKI